MMTNNEKVREWVKGSTFFTPLMLTVNEADRTIIGTVPESIGSRGFEHMKDYIQDKLRYTHYSDWYKSIVIVLTNQNLTEDLILGVPLYKAVYPWAVHLVVLGYKVSTDELPNGDIKIVYT